MLRQLIFHDTPGGSILARRFIRNFDAPLSDGNQMVGISTSFFFLFFHPSIPPHPSHFSEHEALISRHQSTSLSLSLSPPPSPGNSALRVGSARPQRVGLRHKITSYSCRARARIFSNGSEMLSRHTYTDRNLPAIKPAFSQPNGCSCIIGTTGHGE